LADTLVGATQLVWLEPENGKVENTAVLRRKKTQLEQRKK
jgi:hypothetical protein